MIAAPLVLLAMLMPQALFTGTETDYQPSIVTASDGSLLVVFERLKCVLLWRSLRHQTASNERAPSLIATSSHALERWNDLERAEADHHGPIDLGWPTPGEINPDAIREADGSLTMTYHRLLGGSHIARSFDAGVTWDARRTEVAPGSALPRIAKRESDGTYLVTYQINPGTNRLQMFAKTSRDPYDWSAAAAPFSVEGNSHDSDPHVLIDGRFAVVYADARNTSTFNLFLRTSTDGRTWSAPGQITRGATNDVQPHLVDHDGRLLLLWSRDFDLWIDEIDLRKKRRSVR